MSRRRKVVVSGFGVLVIVIVSMIVFGLQQYRTPAQGVIDYTGAKPEVAKQFDLTPKTFAGKLANFQYPASMKLSPNGRLAYPVVEQINFSYVDSQSWYLAINIMDTPSGKLTDNNSYQFRKSKPEIYKLSTIRVGSKDIEVMTDATDSGFNKVAYLVGNTKIVTVSLSGSDVQSLTNLQKTFEMVIGSWQWR